jgi:cytochrome b subunit of formate dehydrogenase
VEIFRKAANPWGQEVLIGIGWGLMWAAIIGGAVFVVVHAVLAARALRAARARVHAPASVPAGLPPRIQRHGIGARFFHWTMSIAMLALLVTAFVPVIGYKFDWVTIHWIAGILLIGTLIYHLVHVLFWQRMSNMWISKADVRDGMSELSIFTSGNTKEAARKPGKYPVAQKVFHHVATAAALAAVVTGLLMMVRIETPIFRRNPYLLEDGTWGLVYVLHGLGGVMLIGLVMAHVYFAIRPEKRLFTRSMFKGWITREEYAAHHDPERWKVGEVDSSGSNERMASPPAVRAGT